MSEYSTLFSAIGIGSLRLRNRLAHASMTTRLVKDGVCTERMINYHGNRARGGAGLIVTEPLALLRRQQADMRRPSVFHRAGLDALSRLAEAVESEDCRLLGQIQDSGRGRHEVGRNDRAIGASALPDDLSWTVPHALSGAEVRALIEEFSASSVKLKTCGFSGVEISAGHGHLFHQFLSPQANSRSDEYGGDVEGRTRLLRELVASIRAHCGRQFIIGLKLPGDDGVAGGIDLAQAGLIAAALARAGGFDYWTFAWGAHAFSLYAHLPDAHGPRAPYLKAIKKLRQADAAVPTGALGYITDPNEAEHALLDGTADLVFLGRPLVTDPAWGVKAQQGREADIRYCVSCNTCWRTIIEGARIECDNNPRVGEAAEADWRPAPADQSRRVVIVGAGIAGLEAAWVAAARGHQVTVFGASDEVGGKTRLHAQLPGGENLSGIYDYQRLMGERYGVHYRLGAAADDRAIAALQPDVVVLACGSRTTVPAFVPAEYAEAGFITDVREFSASFLDRSRREAGGLLIYDKDHTEMTYAAAEYFADIFDTVTIATPRERIAGDVSLINRQGIYARLMSKRVSIETCVEPQALTELEDGLVRLRNVYNGDETRITGIVAITYAAPRRPNNALLAPLRARRIEVNVIGDCYAPRSVLAATREGHAAGLAL